MMKFDGKFILGVPLVAQLEERKTVMEVHLEAISSILIRGIYFTLAYI